MATIYIDNKPYVVKDGQNLLQACLSLGFDVPYFCWHPALGSVGACRLCAVKQFKDEHDTQGRIVMSCMTPVTPGLRIALGDDEVRAFRASVLDWLMTNHPHDCPVCDEGGECHLQDMTVMTGHNYREYRFQKRTHVNQYLGPFLHHEMNRCIQCYRCVRFYCDYAGGRDFSALAAHHHVYFGRHEDGALENEFSGNLVEVCPTGVFTDKTAKPHYTRSWDLQSAPSVCVHCGVGCNITPGERYGQLRRIRNRYNGQVNGYFLCDRGRYGYEFVNADSRIRHPWLVRSGAGAAVSRTEVLAYLTKGLSISKQPETRTIGIGSPRASLESNFALQELVGPDHFHLGVSEPEGRLVSALLEVLHKGPARAASLREIGEADAIFIVGEDVTNVAPRIALQVRQAGRNLPLSVAEKTGIPRWNDSAAREAIQTGHGPLFIATPCATKLDEIATYCYRAAPDDLARLGYAMASALDPMAPPVPDLSDEVRLLADSIACTLASARRPLVISGLSCGSEAVIRAAANVAWALSCGPCRSQEVPRPPTICFTAPECNTVGLGLMGGYRLEDAFRAAERGEVDTVIVLENDLYRRAERERVDAFLEAVKHVIVIDHTRHGTAAKAEVALPAAAFPEGDGTLVSHEVRAQRFIQVYVPEGDIQESWRWLARMGGTPWHCLDDVQAALVEALPAFRGVLQVAPAATARFVGQRLPRQPHRYSGRTAMRAHISVSETKIPEDPDSPFTFSMEGYRGTVPGAVIPSFWSPGWNSVQSLTKFQEEVAGPLRGGDPGVRLIEPAEAADPPYFGTIPEAFRRREAQWLFVPLHDIFGSEELSALCASVAARAPQPYLVLNDADADALGVTQGDSVDVNLAGTVYRWPVDLRPAMPGSVAGVPVGLPGLAYVRWPIWGGLTKGYPP